MIVHDLDVVGVAAAPCEADPPLIVDTDAVLASTGASQRLQSVARRRAQNLERVGGVEHCELGLSAARKDLRKPLRDEPLEDRRRALGLLSTSARQDHAAAPNPKKAA